MDEQGECGCGAVGEWYGPDPFAEAMCDAYGCDDPECFCRVDIWLCAECDWQSVQDI